MKNSVPSRPSVPSRRPAPSGRPSRPARYYDLAAMERAAQAEEAERMKRYDLFEAALKDAAAQVLAKHVHARV